MILLVSGSTRTVRGLADCCRGHLGHLLSPACGNSLASACATGLPWAADNGAYAGFDPDGFRRFAARVRSAPRPPLWLAVPDVVADARATLARWRAWAPELAGLPLALVGQDGAEGLALPWDDFCCLFLGGSTRWKLSQCSADLAAEAKRRGKLLHMGRVNSLRRLEAAYQMGADSTDGSSLSRFGDKYIHAFVRRARRLHGQPLFPAWFGPTAATAGSGCAGAPGTPP